MSRGHQLSSYLKYLAKAKTRFYIHSPFVFDFINNVKRNTSNYYAFQEIDKIYIRYLSSNEVLEIEDFGAGSIKNSSRHRKLSDIASIAGSGLKKGKILFHLVNHYQAQNILELGTSLGLGTLYLAKANSEAKIYTVEGSSEVARIADETFRSEGMNNISLFQGTFHEHLTNILQEMRTVDLAFVDGHHEEQATLEYFEQILPFIHEDSILVFDDIYWSKGMTSAWQKIKQDPKVTVSIDLYQLGICFFHPSQAKENFQLYF